MKLHKKELCFLQRKNTSLQLTYVNKIQLYLKAMLNIQFTIVGFYILSYGISFSKPKY